MGDICPRGHYCPVGSYSAIACPIGTYRSEVGGLSIDSCTECPDGFLCNSRGAINYEKDCESGFYCPGDNLKIPCPEGFYCPLR